MSWLSSLKSVFSPAQGVNEEEIQNVLQNYVLPNSSHLLKDRITQVNVEGQILQITVRTYPDEAEDLQKIHDDLAVALEKCGIQELNMHVIQQKHTQAENTTPPKQADIAPQGSSSTQTKTTPSANPKLPPTIDASARTDSIEAQKQEDLNNPPIQKPAPQQRDVAKNVS